MGNTFFQCDFCVLAVALITLCLHMYIHECVLFHKTHDLVHRKKLFFYREREKSQIVDRMWIITFRNPGSAHREVGLISNNDIIYYPEALLVLGI